MKDLRFCCHICKGKYLRYFLTFRRGGKIYICDTCTNAITVPQPRVSYKKSQFFASGENESGVVRSYLKPIIDSIKEYKAKGRLLDVGAGSGILLEEASKAGFTAEGIEPSSEAVVFCRKRRLKIKEGYLTERSYRKESFDVIVLSHVLEHVENSISFLQIIHRALKKDGIVFLSQTNYTGTIPRLLGSFWEGWVTTEHYVHFSPHGIRWFLERRGFEIVELRILPLGYRILWQWGDMHTIANNIYTSVNYMISTLRFGLPFVGDQAYIIARKKKKQQ